MRASCWSCCAGRSRDGARAARTGPAFGPPPAAWCRRGRRSPGRGRVHGRAAGRSGARRWRRRASRASWRSRRSARSRPSPAVPSAFGARSGVRGAQSGSCRAVRDTAGQAPRPGERVSSAEPSSRPSVVVDDFYVPENSLQAARCGVEHPRHPGGDRRRRVRDGGRRAARRALRGGGRFGGRGGTTTRNAGTCGVCVSSTVGSLRLPMMGHSRPISPAVQPRRRRRSRREEDRCQ